MRTVLIIGAGRSASSLIQYLLNKSVEEDLHIIIGDLSLESAQNKTNNHPNATAISSKKPLVSIASSFTSASKFLSFNHCTIGLYDSCLLIILVL